MNAPDRAARFIVPDGQKKISIQKDTKIANAATFVVLCEDHTLGNLVRMQLHRNPHVLFSGYKMPHPLEHRMLIKVHTSKKTSPPQALMGALGELRGEFEDLRRQFQVQATAHREAAGMGGFGVF